MVQFVQTSNTATMYCPVCTAAFASPVGKATVRCVSHHVCEQRAQTIALDTAIVTFLARASVSHRMRAMTAPIQVTDKDNTAFGCCFLCSMSELLTMIARWHNSAGELHFWC